MRPKRSVAIAEENGDTGDHVIDGHGQIELAVPVKITRRYGERDWARRVIDVRLERAVAAPQQNRKRTAKLIGEGEVRFPVPVKIACGHPHRATARRIVNVSLKRPVAVAQQDARGYADSSARLQRILFEIFQRAAARAQQY